MLGITTTVFATLPAEIPLVNEFPVHTLALIAVYVLALLLIWRPFDVALRSRS